MRKTLRTNAQKTAKLKRVIKRPDIVTVKMVGMERIVAKVG